MEKRESKRQRTTMRPPARQQKFSMDSDDEEHDDDEPDQDAVSVASPTRTPEPESVVSPPELQAEQKPRIRISSIAAVSPPELTVWGPDGPIDKGDDTFFRTVGEWYSVVAPLVSPYLPSRKGKSSATDTDALWT